MKITTGFLEVQGGRAVWLGEGARQLSADERVFVLQALEDPALQTWPGPITLALPTGTVIRVERE